MYARHRPTVQIPVSAKNANGMSSLPNSAGMAISSETIDTPITALNGTRAWLTRRNSDQPGHPVARESVPGARGARQAGCGAEQLAHRGDEDHELRGRRVERAREDGPDEAGAIVDGLDIGGREEECEHTNEPTTAEKNTERQTP